MEKSKMDGGKEMRGPARLPLAVKLLIPAAALALVFFAYQSTPSSWFHGDDFSHIYEGKYLSGAQDIKAFFLPERSPGYYRPLDRTLDVVEYALFGTNATAYHVFSLVLYALNIILFVYLACELGCGPWGAVAAGALFLAMPVHVEAVAWAVCRNMLLSATFYILSLLLLLRRMRSGKGRGHLWAALCFLPCAMFYDGGFSLALMWMMLAFIVFNDGRNKGGPGLFDMQKAIVPPMIVFGVYFLFYFTIIHAGYGMTIGPGALRNFNVYIHDMILPYHHEAFIRPFYSILPARFAGGFYSDFAEFVFWVFLSGVLVWLGRGGIAAPAGLCLMAAGMAPFITVYSERYAYFASFGLCLLAAAGIEKAVLRIKNNQARIAAASIAILAATVVCGLYIRMDRERTQVWKLAGEINRGQLRELNTIAGKMDTNTTLAVIQPPVDYRIVPPDMYFGRALNIFHGQPSDNAAVARNMPSVDEIVKRLGAFNTPGRKMRIAAFCYNLPMPGHYIDLTGSFEFGQTLKLKDKNELQVVKRSAGGPCKGCDYLLVCNLKN